MDSIKSEFGNKEKVEILEKQPSEVFYEKRCSQKFRKIHWKTPVPEALF